MQAGIICIVFITIFIAELPDKSMIATFVLSTRFRSPLIVWAGAAAAFLLHVAIAVTAGQALALLPNRIVEAIVTVLFIAGASVLFFQKHDILPADNEFESAKTKEVSLSFLKAFAATFGIVFLGEWGDITQIATANYAAYYQDPFSVAVGSILALWAAAAVAVIAGKKLPKLVSGVLLRRTAGTILLIFAAFGVYGVMQG